MSDSGFWKDIFGQDSLAKHGIKLWWAKVHTVCKTLYIFLLFGFGILSATKRPSCLPANKNDSSTVLTTPEASFIAEICAVKSPWYVNPDTTCTIIMWIVLFAEVMSFSITEAWLNDPVSLFGKAFSLYEESNLSREDFKSYITEPNFSAKKSIDCSRARRIALLLHGSSLYSVRDYFVFRECYMFGIYITIALILSIMDTIGAQMSNDNPAFECKISELDDIFWCLNVSSEYMCTHPWSSRDSNIVFFYYFVLIVHCSALLAAAVIVCRCRKMSPNTALLLRHLWAHGRTLPNMEFGIFVDAVFSKRYRELMKKNVGLVGTVADPQFTEMVQKLNVSTTLNRKPNVRGLIENKRWDWIVRLLENFPQPFDDLGPLKEIDTSLLDDPGVESGGETVSFLRPGVLNYEMKGRSLLFYALHRETGSATFHMRGAMRILEYTKDRERIVCYNGGRVSAKEFVEMEYASVPEYPERVKEMLLGYI